MRKDAKTRNEGANPFLRVNRDRREQIVVGFDLGEIDPATVADAKLIMTIADNHDNWGNKGSRTIHNHPLLVEFTEGNGVNSIVPRAERSRGSGAGTTWMCATDHDISNGHHDCEFPRWFGGDYFQPETGIVAIANGQTGEVVFDVTGDVQAGFDSWLLARGEDGSSGRLDFYSKEHPDVATNPDLAPRLVITAAAPPGSVVWASEELDLAEPVGDQATVPVAATIDSSEPPVVEISARLADVVEAAKLVRVGDAGEYALNLIVNFIETATGEIRIISGGEPLEPALPVTVRSLDPAADVVPLGMPAPASSRVDRTAEVPYVTEELMLLIGSDASDEDVLTIASDLNGVAAGFLPEGFLLLRWLDTDLSIEELEAVATAHPAVLSVSRNYAGVGVARVPDNDPDELWHPWEASVTNWHMKAIGAPEAWDTTVGSSAVKVGFVDKGYNSGHADLSGQIVRPPEFDHAGDEFDPETGLPLYHGNHVAGTACAEGDNGIGIAGVAWRCAVSLYETESDTSAKLWDFLSDAAEDGNRIVNMSMAIRQRPGCPWLPYSAEALEELNSAFDHMVAAHPETLFVFAAGNNCEDVARVPGKDENAYSSAANVIVVAAVNENLELAERFPSQVSGSNFGSGVSIAAPGVNILSLTDRDCTFGLLCEDLYATYSGTSMAAPLVSGAAALVLSANPDLSASQVKTCLVDAASKRSVPGHDFGILDIPGSLGACESAEILTTSLPATAPSEPYLEILQAVGGAGPYSWRISAGQLPPGLNLDPATGALSGEATEVGTYSFFVEVTTAVGLKSAVELVLDVRSAVECAVVDLAQYGAPSLPTFSIWQLNATGTKAIGGRASTGNVGEFDDEIQIVLEVDFFDGVTTAFDLGPLMLMLDSQRNDVYGQVPPSGRVETTSGLFRMTTITRDNQAEPRLFQQVVIAHPGGTEVLDVSDPLDPAPSAPGRFNQIFSAEDKLWLTGNPHALFSNADEPALYWFDPDDFDAANPAAAFGRLALPDIDETPALLQVTPDSSWAVIRVDEQSYRVDLGTGATTPASVNAQGTSTPALASITSDGSLSASWHQGPFNTNARALWVTDIEDQQRVEFYPTPAGERLRQAQISADGRYVAYAQEDTPSYELRLRDRLTGADERWEPFASLSPGDGPSSPFIVRPDGLYSILLGTDWYVFEDPATCASVASPSNTVNADES